MLASHVAGLVTVLQETESAMGKALKFAEDDILAEALRLLDERQVLTIAEYKKLEAAIRKRAFSMALAADEVILTSVADKIAAAVADGDAWRDVLENMHGVFDAAGVTQLNDYYLANVFRSNSMTAYGEGRRKVMESLDGDEFPFRQVTGIADDRQRDGHTEVDGYTATADDDVWTWLVTPFSYECRCTIRPVHKSEGLTESGYVPDVRGRAGFEFLT